MNVPVLPTPPKSGEIERSPRKSPRTNPSDYVSVLTNDAIEPKNDFHFDLQMEEKVKVVLEKLKKLYKTTIRPIESAYKFHEFASPLLNDIDFDANPMVLLLGQYSTGKTTFCEYLLQRDFPGSRIGPEPTTDGFVALMYSNEERTIPGNAAAVQSDKPFAGLVNKHGMEFLNKFEVSLCNSNFLKKITLVDTPGVLSGEKQRIGRAYDFPAVVEWFASKADRIILLFDAYKLDISDEFKRVIEALKGQDDKIRVVLNKADSISDQELMRVYGALMWSLGKVMRNPEVVRVFLGSFWNKPLNPNSNVKLFQAEMNDLLLDIYSIPKNACIRKINELVKRARHAKVHACILSYLSSKFGWFFKDTTQKELLAKLPDLFMEVASKYTLPLGDFPNFSIFKSQLEIQKVYDYPSLDKSTIEKLDKTLSQEIPLLLKQLPGTDNNLPDPSSEKNPFLGSDINTNRWIIDKVDKTKYYDVEFMNLYAALEHQSSESINVNTIKLSGDVIRKYFQSICKLPNRTLAHVWKLSDIDNDGMLDSDEFAVALYLIDGMNNNTITKLPQNIADNIELCPFSKRKYISV